MKKHKLKWNHGMAIALMLLGLTLNLFIRFSNPNMTEAQLLLTYWPAWGACIAVFLLACALWRLD